MADGRRGGRNRYGVVAALAALTLLTAVGCTRSEAATPATAIAAAAKAAPPAPMRSTPMKRISHESPYSAFPFTTRTADGSYLTTYGVLRDHLDPNARFVVRLSKDGVNWSKGVEPAKSIKGDRWGSAGIASETKEQGGRIYSPILHMEFEPGTRTITRMSPYLSTSDDGGRTWTTFRKMPAPVDGLSFPQNAIVLRDGSVLYGMYVKGPQKGSHWRAHYFRSADRGKTWKAVGVVAIPGRDAAEPTFAQMKDGRIVSFLRSDEPGAEPDRIYYTVHGTTWDGKTGWSKPVAAISNASGMPSPVVLDDGYVLVLYRGFSDSPESVRGHPVRAMLLRPDLTTYRTDIRLTDDDTRRFVYGNVVDAGDGYRAVISLERDRGTKADVFSFGIRTRPDRRG